MAGQTVTLHRRVVRFYDLAVETGVLAVSIEADSPAAKAGIREGDVIVAYSGKPVANVDDLHRLLTEEQVRLASEITIVRGTERLARTITPALHEI